MWIWGIGTIPPLAGQAAIGWLGHYDIGSKVTFWISRKQFKIYRSVLHSDHRCTVCNRRIIHRGDSYADSCIVGIYRAIIDLIYEAVWSIIVRAWIVIDNQTSNTAITTSIKRKYGFIWDPNFFNSFCLLYQRFQRYDEKQSDPKRKVLVYNNASVF